MQKSTKLGLLAGAALVSFSGVAGATAACSNGTPATITAGTNFIKNTFAVKCSKNVNVEYLENSTQLGVCAASKKGSKNYGGNSEGGAVGESGTYASGVVTATTAGCS